MGSPLRRYLCFSEKRAASGNVAAQQEAIDKAIALGRPGACLPVCQAAPLRPTVQVCVRSAGARGLQPGMVRDEQDLYV